MWVVRSSTTPTQQPKRRSGRIRLARIHIMKGRILVDVPEHKLNCGEYADLPDVLAQQLEADGRFDPQAPYPGDESVPNTEQNQDNGTDQTQNENSDLIQDESDESVEGPSKSVKSRKSS